MISEKVVVRLINAGDKAAFDFVFNLYAPQLWALILKFTKDKIVAADILKDSFEKIMSSGSEFDQAKSRLLSWMVRVTIGQCICRLSISKAEVILRLSNQMNL